MEEALHARKAGVCGRLLYLPLSFAVNLKLLGRAVPCLAAQSCLTLCNPMDCSPPGSSGIVEWVVMPSSRASSQPSD